MTETARTRTHNWHNMENIKLNKHELAVLNLLASQAETGRKAQELMKEICEGIVLRGEHDPKDKYYLDLNFGCLVKG